MNSSSYKAFLFDVDKTLTNSNRQVSDRIKNSLHRLHEEGWKIGVCSGRQYTTVSHLLQSAFPPDALHVLSGGGQLTTTTGEINDGDYIPPEIILQILDLANIYHCRLLLQDGQQLFGNQKAIDYATNYFVQGEKVLVPTLATHTSHFDQCPLITIGEISNTFVEKVKELPIQCKDMIGYSGNPYVDITAEGVTKAKGLKKWCTMMGMKPEEVIGFGDSENDLEFLQIVGYAVAMGNATDAVKAIADEVTEDCDHDGIAVWIERNLWQQS